MTKNDLDYHRNKLREHRSKKSDCDCGKPATTSYHGDRVCNTCFARQTLRDRKVDRLEDDRPSVRRKVLVESQRKKFGWTFGVPSGTGGEKKVSIHY